MASATTFDGSSAPQKIHDADPSLSMGWIGRADQQLAPGIVSLGDFSIAFDGELYGASAARQGARKTDGCPARAEYDANTLLKSYIESGVQAFADVEGRFSAAIWDGQLRQLLLVSDKFGTKPLYYAAEGQSLAFASEIKSLLALPELSKNFNRQGLVEFFAYGQLWNQDTLLTSIKCLDAATAKFVDDGGKLVRQVRYWRPCAGARLGASASLDAIDHALKVAVDERTEDVVNLGISLSGGLDARTLLGVLSRQLPPPACVSLGMEGSLDRVSGQRLAELAGCRFYPVVLDGGFLRDFGRHLNRMIELTDGQYLSQCIVMPSLPRYAELGIDVLLRGHAGELVHMRKAYNFSIGNEGASLTDGQQLLEWLYPRLQSHLTAGLDGPVLRGVSQSEFAALARNALEIALAETSHWDHPVDRVSQLFLDQRTRRETAVSLVKFQTVVDCRLPYLDGRVMNAVFGAPPELRLTDAIQAHILKKRRPEFLRPANSNTGAPVDAGSLRRTWCGAKMRVLAKLGAKGFQPYERLGLWLRRELRPIVESTLLSETCLDRGLLEPDAVRRAVRSHLSGENNHTFLLMAMIILELGCRRFIDCQPAFKGRHERATNAQSA